MTLVIPMVSWQDAREEWVVDIYSRLLQDRIIFVGSGSPCHTPRSCSTRSPAVSRGR